MTQNVGGPPRKHHFVTQSWIRRFISADGTLQTYDWERDRIEDRSSKAIMMIYDLYTIDPDGALDTTTETTTLAGLDDAFPRLLARLDAGDRSSELRENLARYFAAQAMRDPEVIASYTPRSQDYALALVDAIDAPSYAVFFDALRQAFPGADLTEDEFDQLRQWARSDLEAAIQAAIDELGQPGGSTAAPRTDLVNATSGRDLVQGLLLSFDWSLGTASGRRRFVLGDKGLLFDKGGLGAGLRVPVSPTCAIYMTPSTAASSVIADQNAEDWQVAALNLESAARARRWVVGERNELEIVRSQAGTTTLPSV